MSQASISHVAKLARRWVWKTFSTAVSMASQLRLGRRFPILRRMYWAIQPRLKPGHALVGGRWMAVHRNDVAIADALLKHGVYEPYETTILSQLLFPGATFVDVGANIGYHTLAAAEIVGADGKVVAVEPSRGNLQLLNSNVRAAGLTNVVILNCAAGSRSGQVLLYESPSNAGDHRTYAVADREAYEVPVRPLDEILQQLELVPDVIKIDIQGYEPWAIRGLRRSLGRADRCAILTEFWPAGLQGAASSGLEYFDLLDELGFELFRIDEASHQLEPFQRSQAAAADLDTNLVGFKGVDPPCLATGSRTLPE